jgi:hypothetical protein
VSFASFHELCVARICFPTGATGAFTGATSRPLEAGQICYLLLLFAPALTARHRADDEERFNARYDFLRQGCLRRFVRKILFARVESDKRATL